MTHDILNPLLGLESVWHEAVALRYHAPCYAVAFHGGVLLFSRANWEPVFWGPPELAREFLLNFRLPPTPQYCSPPSLDISLDDLIGDLL